jgi:transposase
MSVYVGMDVHRKRSQVAIVDQAGAVQRNRNVPNDPAELSTVLGGLPAGTPVAFEAAYGWGWLVELLEGLELEPHLVHPSRSHGDRLGQAEKRQGRCADLAQLLRGDLLPAAWIAPQPVRDLRALLRHRVSLVRLSTCARTGSTRCSPTAACTSTPACGPLPGGRGLPPWSSHPWHDRSWRTAAR